MKYYGIEITNQISGTVVHVGKGNTELISTHITAGEIKNVEGKELACTKLSQDLIKSRGYKTIKNAENLIAKIRSHYTLPNENNENVNFEVVELNCEMEDRINMKWLQEVMSNALN